MWEHDAKFRVICEQAHTAIFKDEILLESDSRKMECEDGIWRDPPKCESMHLKCSMFYFIIKNVLHSIYMFMFNGGSSCGSTIHPIALIDTKNCMVYHCY